MKKKGNIVAIIPARAGSKRIPNKNIREIDGKPLIAYTIEEAKKSKLLDRIIVSTDSEKIAGIARKYGAEVPFIRPSELATDTAPTSLALIHAVDYLEKTENYPVDVVVILQPNCPLRTAGQIDEGIKKLLELDADSLVGLKKADPPWWLFRTRGDKVELFLKDDKIDFYTRSQDFPPVYLISGALHITRKEWLMKTGKPFNLENCGYIIMDKESSVDIDEMADFMLAEQIIKLRKRGGNKK